MIALFLQTLLLMAAAYFVGTAVACLVRRSFYVAAKPEPAAARPVEPLPEFAQRAAGPARFGHGAEGEARPAPPPPAAVATAAVVPPATVPAAAPAPAQDLKRIRLIDSDLEAGLNKLGVRRYEEIAGWMQPDVRRIATALGLGDRISRENWIEQAQVLAKGGATLYATRAARGEIAKAAPTADEGEPRRLAPAAASPQVAHSPRATAGGAAAQVAIATPAPAPALPRTQPVVGYSPPDVSGRAAFAAPRKQEPASSAQPVTTVPAPEPAIPVRPALPASRDNLQRISGVDAEIEKLLAGLGIARYSQIAHWSPAEVARVDTQLGGAGRIGRENWIEQAQILSRGGDTAYSRDYDRRARGEATVAALRPAKLAEAIRANAGKATPDAPPPQPQQTRTDFAALRSVRSAAYQAPDAEAAPRVGAQSRVLRSAQLEDLKRIRGIGVLIEKRLNQLGVVAYEQIANWTAQDIDRISQSLDFKGRIERENWVEQAQILASGGATEFSRRVDRGEVETSRYRP